MSTYFSAEQMDFTKRAHLAAQTQFYPKMFPLGVTFVDTVKTVRDLEYAIDCQLEVTGPEDLRAPITLAVQERFRDPSYMHHGDVTITEWNLATNLPSELHKLGAQLFVYGFYDEKNDHISLAVALDVAMIQLVLTRGELKYTREKRFDQSFLGFQIADLRRAGVVLFEWDGRGGT